MDAVKKENHRSRKVQVGDCVSAPDDYFGKSFRKSMLIAGMDITRIYGLVIEVLLELRVQSVSNAATFPVRIALPFS